ncbi:hypothetical protein [Planobispora rosea]|nr:hypothetical protein [Planobispora rosea]
MIKVIIVVTLSLIPVVLAVVLGRRSGRSMPAALLLGLSVTVGPGFRSS